MSDPVRTKAALDSVLRRIAELRNRLEEAPGPVVGVRGKLIGILLDLEEDIRQLGEESQEE